MVPDKPQKVENFHFTWCGYIGFRTRWYVKLITKLWVPRIFWNFDDYLDFQKNQGGVLKYETHCTSLFIAVNIFFEITVLLSTPYRQKKSKFWDISTCQLSLQTLFEACHYCKKESYILTTLKVFPSKVHIASLEFRLLFFIFLL